MTSGESLKSSHLPPLLNLKVVLAKGIGLCQKKVRGGGSDRESTSYVAKCRGPVVTDAMYIGLKVYRGPHGYNVRPIDTIYKGLGRIW